MVPSVQNRDSAFSYCMDDDDIVFGLGEANRGINKRGWKYTSFCTDDPEHTEEKVSLYGAHNFLIVSGRETFGLFIDYPAALTFDVGYTKQDMIYISCQDANLNLYVIDGDSPYDIVKQFRHIIGRSYIPPKFAFGFGQSRWGYKNPEGFRKSRGGLPQQPPSSGYDLYGYRLYGLLQRFHREQ